MYRVPDDQGARLDVFLSNHLPELSRARIQAIIRGGSVWVNDHTSKPSAKLRRGDRITITIPPQPRWDLKAEPVPFGIVYEDDHLIVVNKPAGLVVHPAPGHPSGTLVHGLLDHCQGLSSAGDPFRPGIVHRLDKDTSGLIVAAKNDRAHGCLGEQFKSGEVRKEYLSIVHGTFPDDRGTIDRPIGRHPKRRKEMAVVPSGGRGALTQWQKMDEFVGRFTLLSVTIRTGRTHQIRVHLASVGHPVAGDPVYGYGRTWWKNNSLYKRGLLPLPERQMLHARHLGFAHPETGKFMEFDAPAAKDMEELIKALQAVEEQPFGKNAVDI